MSWTFVHFFLSLVRYLSTIDGLTSSAMRIPIIFFLRMEREELNFSVWWYQHISKLCLVFLWITSFFFYREYEKEKNRNDAPFCFFNRFIVRVPSWYFFFFFLILFVQDIILGKFFFSFLCTKENERERQKSSTRIRVYVQASTVLV